MNRKTLDKYTMATTLLEDYKHDGPHDGPHDLPSEESAINDVLEVASRC